MADSDSTPPSPAPQGPRLTAGGFVKLYASIRRSSVWFESATTRIVWITLLLGADTDGHYEGALIGLADDAKVTLDEARLAVAILEAPDPNSKNPAHDGRRIRAVQGGWNVLNFIEYREMRTETQAARAARQARWRAAKRAQAQASTVDAVDAERRPATQVSVSASASTVRKEERATENAEASACEATCRAFMALTGRELDEVLWEFSEFKGRRLVRLDTAPLGWLRATHDRVRIALIEARKAAEPAARPRGEEPLARIKRIEAERAARERAS